MNINSIFSQINNAISQSTGNVPIAGEEAIDSIRNGMESLLSKNVNSVISGQVVSAEGKSLLLALSENEMIKATLEGNANAKPGQIMTFQVMGNSEDGKVTLSPLFANTAQSSMASHALSEANLPDDPKMQYMVKSMMDEGLPIDKQSLYDMNKAMALNENVDVSNLAKMQRLNIPLTPEMAEQFEHYQNLEHELTNVLSDLSDNFFAGVDSLLSGDNVDTALQFLNDVSMVLFSEETQEVSETTGNVSNDNVAASTSQVDKASDNSVAINDEFDDILSDIKREVTALKTNSEVSDSETKKSETNVNTDKKQTVQNVFDLLDKAIKKADTPELKLKLSEEIKDLFKDSDFSKETKQFLVNKFALEPKELATEGSVSKLYERLGEETKQLLNILNNSEGKSTAFSETVRNMSSNLEFMNELNQTFNYVQIPLKFDDGNKNGELYVYTNRKSLKNNDGNVSALLHLDMDNLGPVDVHVTLNTENNVKTKFFLKDDEALDLISKNIDRLNERLNNRGYNMSAEFVNKEDNNTVLDTILEDNKNISVVSGVAFDARA